MAPTNHAVFLKTPKGPLVVEEAPYTPPGPHELVVKTAAMAINPVDVYKQIRGDDLLPYIKMPCVPGQDVAGEVVEVGSAVTRFVPGDRVLGEAAGTTDFANRTAEGAFQAYVVLREQLVAVIPASISFARATVLPLCFSTAVFGLFHPSTLALPLPPCCDSSNPAPSPPSKGTALLITSGASSVGASAIQLAVAAGYEVHTTTSPKNFDLVRRLGATHVVDYHDMTTAADALVAGLHGKDLAGALAINPGGVTLTGKVLAAVPNSVKFIADAGPPRGEEYPDGITSKFFIPNDLHEPDSLTCCLWRTFLPQALAEGSFVPEPEPLVVGQGLDKMQEAYDVFYKGVSAQKVVVTL